MFPRYKLRLSPSSVIHFAYIERFATCFPINVRLLSVISLTALLLIQSRVRVSRSSLSDEHPDDEHPDVLLSGAQHLCLPQTCSISQVVSSVDPVYCLYRMPPVLGTRLHDLLSSGRRRRRIVTLWECPSLTPIPVPAEHPAMDDMDSGHSSVSGWCSS